MASSKFPIDFVAIGSSYEQVFGSIIKIKYSIFSEGGVPDLHQQSGDAGGVGLSYNVAINSHRRINIEA